MSDSILMMTTTPEAGASPSRRGLDEATLSGVRRAMLADGGDTALPAAVAATGRILGSDALQEIALAARAELSGAGPLQAWIEAPGVTDVLVNGHDEVWVERHGRLERTPVRIGSAGGVRALAVRLAALAGQRLDDAEPICDGALPDGTRFHAVLRPLCASGAVISLRVLRQGHFTLTELAGSEMFPSDWGPLLGQLVAGRANVLVSGGTGSGKTTLMAAMLGAVAPGERVITVEEARELAPVVNHHVPLVARRANVEGAGEVTLADLVRAALRMRPDRLVLGECRGAEVREVLQAMNTGHDGAMATVHANSAAGVPARLEALAALAGMSREAVAAQVLGAVDVVLQVRRDAGGGRRLCEIGVPVAGEAGLAVEVVGSWAGPGTAPWHDSPRWPAFAARWRP